MSLSLAKQPLSLPSDGGWARVDVTFDSSYAGSGGEALTAKDLGFTQVIAVLPVGRTSGGYVVNYNANKLGVYIPEGPKVKVGTGAAAGNVTVTGVAVGDVLTSVLLLCDSATVTLDLTSQFAVCATDTIGNAAGTTTAGGKVVASFVTKGGLTEVASTTDLSAETVTLLVLGIK